MKKVIEFAEPDDVRFALRVADTERNAYPAVASGRVSMTLEVFDMLRAAVDEYLRRSEEEFAAAQTTTRYTLTEAGRAALKGGE